MTRKPPVRIPGGALLHHFEVGDRVKVTISGRTGTIVKRLSAHNGWRVRWDEPMFGVTEGRVATVNMEPLQKEEA